MTPARLSIILAALVAVAVAEPAVFAPAPSPPEPTATPLPPPAAPPPTSIAGFPNCGPRRPTKGVPPRSPDATLCANVTELPAGGGLISVAWTGVVDPSRKDEVALYYASTAPGLGEHPTPDATPAKAAALRLLGPPPGLPIKSLPAAGVGDAAGGVGAAHLASGSGTATFAVANLRWPVVVALQTTKWGRLSVEAVTGPIAFSHPDAPQQVVVGAGRAAGAATVRWATAGGGGGGGGGRASPRLRWGWAPGQLTAGDVAAATFTYGVRDMCGGDAVPGFTDPGALHSAVVEWAAAAAAAGSGGGGGGGGGGANASSSRPLAPPALARARRRVHYEIYDPAAPPGTPPFAGSFLPLAPGGRASRARILFAADVGQAEADGSSRPLGWQYAASLNTSRGLAGDVDPAGGFGATSTVIGGDVAYANGHAPVWDAFFVQFQPAFAGAPTLFATGNHEQLWTAGGAPPAAAAAAAPFFGDRFGNQTDSGGECGIPFAVRTGGGSGAPGPPGGDGSGRANPPWFSYDDGPVHVQVYSTEHPFRPGTPQHAWIAADLAGVDRAATPWVVVVGHRPPYVASTYPGGGNASDAAVAVDLAAWLEPLWLEAGVDLTLAGHHHSYQRTCAMAGGGRCADGRSAAGAAGYNASAASPSAPIPALADLPARPASGGGPPVHVVAGIGGGDLTDNAQPWPSPEAWDAVAFQHGYVRLAANGRESLVVTAVRSADGAVLDAFELRKGQPVRTLGGVGVTAAPDVAAASVGGGRGAR